MPDEPQEDTEAAFAAGFSGTHDTVAAAPEVKTVSEAKPETKPDSPSTPQTEPAAAPAPAAEPVKFGGMSEDEFKALVSKIPALEQQLPGIQQAVQEEIRKIYGKFGELNRTIEALRAGRKVTAAQMKRLNQEFPEIAGMLADDLNEAWAIPEPQTDQTAQGQPQTAPPSAAPAPQALQQADIQKLIEGSVQSAVAGISAQAERKALALAHPDWEEVAQSPEFATWLQSLPSEQARIYAESEDAKVAAEAFSLFKQAKQAKVTTRQTKQDRLQRAVAPTGEAAPKPDTIDDEQAFVMGFQSQRGSPA